MGGPQDFEAVLGDLLLEMGDAAAPALWRWLQQKDRRDADRRMREWLRGEATWLPSILWSADIAVMPRRLPWQALYIAESNVWAICALGHDGYSLGGHLAGAVGWITLHQTPLGFEGIYRGRWRDGRRPIAAAEQRPGVLMAPTFVSEQEYLGGQPTPQLAIEGLVRRMLEGGWKLILHESSEYTWNDVFSGDVPEGLNETGR